MALYTSAWPVCKVRLRAGGALVALAALAALLLGELPADAQVPGGVYVVDDSTNSALRLDPEGVPSDGDNQVLITEDGMISTPTDLVVGNEELFISDTGANGIIRVDLATQQQEAVPANGPGGAVQFEPVSLALDSLGRIIVATRTPFLILRIDTATDMVFNATPSIGWGAPGDVALGADDEEIFVRDGPFLWRVDLVGQTRERVGRHDSGDGFVVDPQTGLIYFAVDGFPDDTVVQIDPEAYDDNDQAANRTLVSDDPLLHDPVDIGILPDGDLVVTNGSGTVDEVLRIDRQSGTATVIGTAGDLALPQGIAVAVPEPMLASLHVAALAALAGLSRKRAAA